jgi:Uma2 family endonuclease
MATAQQKIGTQPDTYRWSRKEYYRLGDLGFFEGKRVELIEGRIIEMSPIYSPHVTSVTLADDLLREVFGKGFVVRIQAPLGIGEDSDLQPDVAVVAGSARDFSERHPARAELVVEVADASLAYDRGFKASFYATAGIADYWIVNLKDRQIEIHRRPMKDAEADFGHSYADKQIFREGEFVFPLAKQDALIPVADLLP